MASRVVLLLAVSAAVVDALGTSEAAGRKALALSAGQLRGFGAAASRATEASEKQEAARRSHGAAGAAAAAGQHEAVRPADGGAIKIAGWTMHHVGGLCVFLAFLGLLCWPVPIVRQEYENYNEFLAGGKDTFKNYLSYRFSDWFTTYEFAPSLVLIFLTMALIVCGAVMYALVMGESPAHSLWRIFVWASGSPAEGEVTPFGRFLGLTVTIAGMIILSLLFGIVSEVFAQKMSQSRQGLQKVVEGGHVVMLGYTDCSRCMLEELASARDSDGGGTFVILCRQPKEDVEKELFQKDLSLRSSRLIIRQGNACYTRDLEKVAVHSASQVILLANTKLSPEEADAQTVRAILALKGKGWPTKGRIVIQCANPSNKTLFQSLIDAEVVVVGNIVAKLMVQSSQQHGLANVFGMMLGFEGDEFYMAEWPKLVGSNFKEVTFRFPDAVCMGVFKDSGQCLLNPGWDYTMEEGDQLIVLAEDNDSYEPTSKLYWEPSISRAPSLPPTPTAAHNPMDAFTESHDLEKLTTCAQLREQRESKVLIVGWNPNVGPLLSNLDDLVGLGTKVTVFSSQPTADRESFLEVAQHTHNDGDGYAALKIKHVEVEHELFSSRIELAKLRHFEYDKIFILAEGINDSDEDNRDEKSIAVLAQLQLLNAKYLLKSQQSEKAFDPVVEMCEDSTREHLKICGFTNFVHSSSLVSQALAAVTEEPMVNAVYAELMSGKEQSFDIRDYADFLKPGQELPEELSFAEAAWQISTIGEITLIAWSHPDTWNQPEVEAGHHKDVQWEMNPVDKTEPRVWTPQDRVVVLRRFRPPPSEWPAKSTISYSSEHSPRP